MYIDGDVFITEGGVLERFTRGKSDGWEPGRPSDDAAPTRAPTSVLVAGSGDQRAGPRLRVRPKNDRVLAFDKSSGDYVAQYRLAGGRPDWNDLRGLYVIPGVDEAPATLVWLAAGQHRPGRPRAGRATTAPAPTPLPRPTPSAEPSEPGRRAKPTKKP